MHTPTLRLIMLKAWKLAREGQQQFGGRASQYIPSTLQKAWKIILADKTTQAVLERERRNKRYFADIKTRLENRKNTPVTPPSNYSQGYGRGSERYITTIYGV